MPTILPNPKNRQSTADQFGQAFANLGQAVGQGGSQYLMEREAKRVQDKYTQEENATVKNLTGYDITGMRDPKMREKFVELALQGKMKEQERMGDEAYIDRLIGGGKQGKNEKSLGTGAPREMESGNEPTSLKASDEAILRTTARKPGLGNALQRITDVNTREDRENTKRSDKKEAALREETSAIRKNYADKALAARQSIQNKENLIHLIRKGDIDDPTFAIAAQLLPFDLGKRLLSDDTVTYKGGLIDDYKDLQSIFKGSTRAVEVNLYSDKIPDLYLTDSQKEAILTNRINASKADVVRAEAAAELEAEGKFGGVLQFEKMVEDRAKPQLNALFNQIWEEHKAIIDAAERRKDIPLDANDPDDIQIIDQILQEAGGDYKKAEKLALKKGYKF